MMNTRLRLILCLACMVSLTALLGCRANDEWREAGDFELRLAFDRNEIYIGQTITATLDILHPVGVRPHFEDPENSVGIRVRERAWSSRDVDENRTVSSVAFKLTSFAVGEHFPFDGSVTFHAGGEQVAAVPFDEKAFTVMSKVENDRATPRDIADIRNFPPRFPRWVAVLVLIAVLAATLGAIVARLLSLRPSRPAEIEVEPAHETALRDFEKLRRTGWIEQENFEPFYVELSRIVRVYIERRFELRAPEQTTEEFIRAAAESSKLDPAHRDMVSEFLSQSDMVKFARYRANADMMQDALTAAEDFVRETAITERTEEVVS